MGASVFCAVCAGAVNLARFDSQLRDYWLTCGHTYYGEKESN